VRGGENFNTFPREKGRGVQRIFQIGAVPFDVGVKNVGGGGGKFEKRGEPGRGLKKRQAWKKNAGHC